MSESIYLHKSHNVSVLLCNFVFPTKYRRVVFKKFINESLMNICVDIYEP